MAPSTPTITRCHFTCLSASTKIGTKTRVKKEALVADAVHYFSKIGVAVLKLKGTLKINDKIHVKGFTTDFKQSVTSMQINHQPVKEANKGKEIGIKVKGKVRHADKVYKI